MRIPLISGIARMLFLALVACREGPGTGSPAERMLENGQRGDFRGVNMGDQPEEVREKEGGRIVYSMPDELVYRLELGGGDSVRYEISYNFNDQGLYDIVMDVMARQRSVLRGLHGEICSHYAEKYGRPSVEGRETRWRVQAGNGHIVNILVHDSVPSRGDQKLRISFHERR